MLLSTYKDHFEYTKDPASQVIFATDGTGGSDGRSVGSIRGKLMYIVGEGSYGLDP